MRFSPLAVAGLILLVSLPARSAAAPQIRTRPGWQEGWTVVAIAPTKGCPPLGDCTRAERGLALQLRKAGKRVVDAATIAALSWEMGAKSFDEADPKALLAKIKERENTNVETWVRVAALDVRQERVKVKVQRVVEEEEWAVSTIGTCEVAFTRLDGSPLADGRGGLNAVTPDPGLTVHLEASRILAAMLLRK